MRFFYILLHWSVLFLQINCAYEQRKARINEGYDPLRFHYPIFSFVPKALDRTHIEPVRELF